MDTPTHAYVVILVFKKITLFVMYLPVLYVPQGKLKGCITDSSFSVSQYIGFFLQCTVVILSQTTQIQSFNLSPPA